MIDDETTLNLKEVEARLTRLISDMSETEKRELLERLEKWEQAKLKDARQHLRRQTSIYAVFSGQDCYFRDYIKDISTGGLFIETRSPLAVGQEIILILSLPSHERPIKIICEVVRATQQGIGVKFRPSSPIIEEMIETLVEKI